MATMANCRVSPAVGNATQYLSELLTYKVSKRTLRFSESSVGCYEVPYNSKKTFSDRSYSTVGPRLWNALLWGLKHCESVDTFKRHLKDIFEDFFGLF